MHVQHSHIVPPCTKNQKAAKELLTWLHAKANYDRWFRSGTGYTAEWESNPMWQEDPVMLPYRVAGRLGSCRGILDPPGPSQLRR